MATAVQEVRREPGSGDFPFEFAVLPLESMFVDPTYQRPLTSFVKQVRDRFDPALVGCLVISRRPDPRRRAHPYAIVDGQTRWSAMKDRGMDDAPCIVYADLTVQDEASLFERLQTQRRGVVSFARFRAAMSAGSVEALAIDGLVRACGFTVGARNGVAGPIASVAALEKCFRRDPHTLERALSALREAWRHVTPSGASIRGMHLFFIDNPDADDERLVRRVSIVGEAELLKRAQAFKEGTGRVSDQSMPKYIAMAIEAAYSRRQ